MITDKEIRKQIKDMEKRYKQIHPKWMYFLLLDLWKKYQNLKKKKK